MRVPAADSIRVWVSQFVAGSTMPGEYRWVRLRGSRGYEIAQYREGEYAKPGHGEWWAIGRDYPVDVVQFGPKVRH